MIASILLSVAAAALCAASSIFYFVHALHHDGWQLWLNLFTAVMFAISAGLFTCAAYYWSKM